MRKVFLILSFYLIGCGKSEAPSLPPCIGHAILGEWIEPGSGGSNPDNRRVFYEDCTTKDNLFSEALFDGSKRPFRAVDEQNRVIQISTHGTEDFSLEFSYEIGTDATGTYLNLTRGSTVTYRPMP